jgi:hypothetical protein
VENQIFGSGMSERGSFVTEFIYCEDCFEAAKKVLLSAEKYFCSQVLIGWDFTHPELPIIAGKIGGMYPGEEIDQFRNNLIPKLEKAICCDMRIVVLAEKGEAIFLIKPDDDREEVANDPA